MGEFGGELAGPPLSQCRSAYVTADEQGVFLTLQRSG